MNDFTNQRDDSIGTDPTIMNVIDSLDVEPTVAQESTQNQNKKSPNPNKKNNLLKKILLALAVVALIGGVAFGLFYYLRLGNKKTQNAAPKQTLNPVAIFVGETVSEDLATYGDFSNVDIATCSVDTSKVQNDKAGTYDLTITCDGDVYSTKVVVKERLEFAAEGKVAYKVVKDTYDINDFINYSDDLEVSFKNEELLKMTLSSAGGPFSVEILVKDKEGNETTVYAALYTYQTKPRLSLECTKDNQTDRLSFNNNFENINNSLRMYTYKYENANDYYQILSEISNSRLKINDHNGVPITDEKNKTIKIIDVLSSVVLRNEYGSELPKEFQKINNYYKDKNFSCSSLT